MIWKQEKSCLVKNSNTTLVKVKYAPKSSLISAFLDSNTTLVKVKYDCSKNNQNTI